MDFHNYQFLTRSLTSSNSGNDHSPVFHLRQERTGCWWFSLHACLIHPWRHHHHHLVSRLTADALCCSCCSCSISWSIPTKEMFFWRLRAVSSRIKGSHKFHSFLDKQLVLLVLCNYLLPFSNCFCFLKHERVDCSIEYLGDFYYHPCHLLRY